MFDVFAPRERGAQVKPQSGVCRMLPHHVKSHRGEEIDGQEAPFAAGAAEGLDRPEVVGENLPGRGLDESSPKAVTGIPWIDSHAQQDDRIV